MATTDISTGDNLDGNKNSNNSIENEAQVLPITMNKETIEGTDTFQLPLKEDSKDTAIQDPYAYLSREDFTSEKFKIEIRGLPKFYGIGELKKLLNDKLKLGSNKVKPPKKGSPWVYVCFRSDADRLDALKAIDGYTWKNKTLSAGIAEPAPDPLVRKRTQLDHEEKGVTEGSIRKKQRQNEDNRSQEDRLKSSTTPFWDVPYEEQLRRKEECISQMLLKLGLELTHSNPKLKTWVENQRKKYNGLPCELWSIRKSPILDNYRNKCEFTVGMNEDTCERCVGFRLGSYVRGFTGVGPIDCLSHIPQRMKDAVKIFEMFVRTSPLEVFNPETQSGYWRQLTARLSFATDQLMLIVGVNPQKLSQEELSDLKLSLKTFFESGDGKACNVTSLYFESIYKKQAGVDLLPVEHLLGETHIHETLCGLNFRVSPEAFFQVNTAAAEVLYNSAAEISSPTQNTTVIDICCGTGSIGLSLAKHCGQVLGLELLKPAVDDAKANAINNGITNCDFFAGKAEELLSSVITRAKKSDILAIVDPPRAGLHRKAIVMLRRATKLNKMVFLSCDPRAAMQNFIDLGRPTSKAYHGVPLIPIRAVPVDLFPHTKHCELIVYFERFNEHVHNQVFVSQDQKSVANLPTVEQDENNEEMKSTKETV